MFIRIYTTKNRPSSPKRQICLSSAIPSSMFLLFMKFVTWFPHDCCDLPLLLLPCGVNNNNNNNNIIITMMIQESIEINFN